MAKYRQFRFPRVLTVTILAVVVAIVWQIMVFRVTWLSQRSLWLLGILALVLSVPLFRLLWRQSVFREQKGVTIFTAPLMAFLLSLVLLGLPFYTAVRFTAQVKSHYVASFTWNGGGRYDCSGVDVQDPDLGREIKICSPEGDIRQTDQIEVFKKSNAYGAVVSAARVY